MAMSDKTVDMYLNLWETGLINASEFVQELSNEELLAMYSELTGHDSCFLANREYAEKLGYIALLGEKLAREYMTYLETFSAL